MYTKYLVHNINSSGIIFPSDSIVNLEYYNVVPITLSRVTGPTLQSITEKRTCIAMS